MWRKYTVLLMATLYLCLGVILLKNTGIASAVSLKQGSSGSVVRQIQQRLKNWGYYTGSVDGIYGSRTTAAVKKFQSNNGLVADGVVGQRTAAKIGISLSGADSTTGGAAQSGSNKNDVYLLAKVVYGESRGEPYRGKVAVAAVVLNRVESPDFPNTISSVVYQPGAFSIVNDGQINLAPDEESLKAARDALNGWDPTYGCVYYYNPAKTTNKFMLSLKVVVTIGSHRFVRR
ncbi:MAG: spore cortex-lytic enzyme [Christensenellales bacterium]